MVSTPVVHTYIENAPSANINRLKATLRSKLATLHEPDVTFATFATFHMFNISREEIDPALQHLDSPSSEQLNPQLLIDRTNITCDLFRECASGTSC